MNNDKFVKHCGVFTAMFLLGVFSWCALKDFHHEDELKTRAKTYALEHNVTIEKKGVSVGKQTYYRFSNGYVLTD